MVKTFLKLILLTVLHTVLFIIANAVLPYSQAFKELNSSANSFALVFFMISGVWVCFTIYFVIKNTSYSGKRLFINLFCIMFFVQYFMTQIETLLFNTAFNVLDKLDVVLIMLAGLLPLLGVIPLAIKFFCNENITKNEYAINLKRTAIKLGIVGIIYLCIYMVFGYFVAWQFKELRLFYSGSVEKLSFIGQMANNFGTNPAIFPFQILRGILFGIVAVPLLKMVGKNKITFIISVCLIYLCTAVVLIIPNVLFPDTVRIAHLIEMGTSMLLFGIIVGIIMWENKISTAR